MLCSRWFLAREPRVHRLLASPSPFRAATNSSARKLGERGRRTASSRPKAHRFARLRSSEPSPRRPFHNDRHRRCGHCGKRAAFSKRRWGSGHRARDDVRSLTIVHSAVVHSPPAAQCPQRSGFIDDGLSPKLAKAADRYVDIGRVLFPVRRTRPACRGEPALIPTGSSADESITLRATTRARDGH